MLLTTVSTKVKMRQMLQIVMDAQCSLQQPYTDAHVKESILTGYRSQGPHVYWVARTL